MTSNGKKSVAIIGGGYFGAELAKALQDDLNVTLIERAEAFTHAPAMIRALVQPDLLDKALIPYDKLLSAGTFVQAEAQAIDETGVTLADGKHIPADYIVLATGSSNTAPFKSSNGEITSLRSAQADWNSAISDAKSVAIIGAGAVGTELAGEIAHAYPDKKVSLISSDASLFPSLSPKLGASLLKKLGAMGVDVVLGVRAKDLPPGDTPTGGTVELTNGQKIEADVIVPTVGASPQARLADGLPGVSYGADGRVETDQWMRPCNLPNVFAAGDAANNGDLMTIVAISRQIPWMVKLLKAVAGGADITDQKPYAPWDKAPILLPLGPKRGASFLVMLTAGDWITSMMKGRDLFIAKYRKSLGQK
ncbi:MAG: FAD-dependent oxidoreductase [Pseudomonadota bacterium]